jgi:hypothetical protein
MIEKIEDMIQQQIICIHAMNRIPEKILVDASFEEDWNAHLRKTYAPLSKENKELVGFEVRTYMGIPLRFTNLLNQAHNVGGAMFPVIVTLNLAV